MRSRFQALELSYTIIPHLRRILPAIRKHDAKLNTQLRDAASSIPMNLAEGNRRRGKDRLFLWSVAAGSADEVLNGLRSAAAWGYVPEESVAEVLELLDRLLAMIWRLMN